LAQKISANGNLAAWQEAIIGAEANGLKITEVRVNVGDRVQRGDVLAVLQADSLRPNWRRPKPQWPKPRPTPKRPRPKPSARAACSSKAFSATAQLSQALAAEASAVARVQSARALVQLQNVRLSQTQVRAPDAGVVSARQATVGSVVGAGTELFRLIRQGRIEWRAEVTAAEIGRIQVGAPVQIKAASGQQLQGKVRMVAPSVDAQTRNAMVYVDLPAADGQRPRRHVRPRRDRAGPKPGAHRAANGRGGARWLQLCLHRRGRPKSQPAQGANRTPKRRPRRGEQQASKPMPVWWPVAVHF
jgi:HlyD family secretion protein